MLFSIAWRTARLILVATGYLLKLAPVDDGCIVRGTIIIRIVQELRQLREEKIYPMAITAY
jgi:hypothetical protein